MTEYTYRLTIILPINQRNLLRQFWREIVDFRGFTNTFTTGVKDRENRQNPTHFAMSTAITPRLLVQFLKEIATELHIEFSSENVDLESMRQFVSNLPFLCDIRRFDDVLDFQRLLQTNNLLPFVNPTVDIRSR